MAIKGFITRHKILCIVAVALAAVAVYWFVSHRQAPKRAELPTVEVTRVGKKDVNICGEFAGRIRA